MDLVDHTVSGFIFPLLPYAQGEKEEKTISNPGPLALQAPALTTWASLGLIKLGYLEGSTNC